MIRAFSFKQLADIAKNLNIKVAGSNLAKYVLLGSKILSAKSKDYVYGPTAEQVIANVDLTGKNCLITGGTSGIGLEMVKCLVNHNCDVIMACRNPYTASLVQKSLPYGHERIDIKETNLASLKSVKKLSHVVLEENKPIDILLLNAAVFGIPWTCTEDGLETVFQVNFLSQYYLIKKLQHLLSNEARVVFVSQDSHRNTKLDINYDLPLQDSVFSLRPENYSSVQAYNLSKLCGLLAMHVLAYSWADKKRSVFCANPGSLVKTQLYRNWKVWDGVYTYIEPFTKTAQQAAATPIYCCASPELAGMSDLYFSDCKQADESDQARDLRLAYKADGLFQAIIEDRENAMVTERSRVTETENLKDD